MAHWSWTSRLQNYEEINICCLSHSVCGILLWQPDQTNTLPLSFRSEFRRLFLAMCEGSRYTSERRENPTHLPCLVEGSSGAQRGDVQSWETQGWNPQHYHGSDSGTLSIEHHGPWTTWMHKHPVAWTMVSVYRDLWAAMNVYVHKCSCVHGE